MACSACTSKKILSYFMEIAYKLKQKYYCISINIGVQQNLAFTVVYFYVTCLILNIL